MDQAARVIFHVDLDAFFVAVERILDPSLRDRPVVVGGSPTGRGVVAAASYEARAHGVRSAMPMAQALRLYPGLIRVRGNRDAYRRASRAVFALLRARATRVQRVSIDEAYLDLSDRAPRPREPFRKALELQEAVRRELRLDLSIGIASNRLVAKVASGAAKPAGVLEVLPGQEARFLAPLPLRKLPGIGPATAERLHAARIQTLGELARADPRPLRTRLGREVEDLQRRARGLDERPVREPDPDALPGSISHERTFPHDLRDPEELDARLVELLDATVERLLPTRARAKTVSVKLRLASFETLTRDRTLAAPGSLREDFLPGARALLEGLLLRRPAVRLLGVRLSGLVRGTWQPELFA